jgi:hypothetical protein
MSDSVLTKDEIARRGREIYERDIELGHAPQLISDRPGVLQNEFEVGLHAVSTPVCYTSRALCQLDGYSG